MPQLRTQFTNNYAPTSNTNNIRGLRGSKHEHLRYSSMTLTIRIWDVKRGDGKKVGGAKTFPLPGSTIIQNYKPKQHAPWIKGIRGCFKPRLFNKRVRTACEKVWKKLPIFSQHFPHPPSQGLPTPKAFLPPLTITPDYPFLTLDLQPPNA